MPKFTQSLEDHPIQWFVGQWVDLSVAKVKKHIRGMILQASNGLGVAQAFGIWPSWT